MSTLTSLGIGSGLDVNSIITQLMSIERAPIDKLDTKESGVKSKISAFGSISSALSSLKDAAANLADPSKLAGYKANFADTEIVSGSANSLASAGSYAINVTRLATTHKINSSANFTGIGQKVGEGRFTLDVGGVAKEIEVGANATLGDLRDAINNAKAGVTANLINSDSGTKLVLTADKAGQGISTYGAQDLDGSDGADFVGLLSNFQNVSGAPSTTLSYKSFSSGTEVVGSGTLSLNIAGTKTDIAVPTGANLDDVVNLINTTLTGPSGVTASIQNNRLQITANTTGAAISYSAIDDSSGTEDFTKLAGFSTSQVEIDGQVITSNTNVVSSAINGLSLNLQKIGATTLNVARDTSGVNASVDAFVKAYNDLNSKIRSLTAYDATKKSGSVLTGDATIRTIQNQMSSLIFGTGTSTNTIDTLSDLGIKLSTNGNISVDSGKLSTAISSDLSSVIGTLGNYGSKFKTLATNLTTSGGMLTSRTEGLNQSIKSIEQQRDALELRMTTIEKRYRAQYASLDTIISSMQQTSSYLTKQLAQFG